MHEAPKIGGIGAEIAAVIAEKAIYELESPICRVAAPFTPENIRTTLAGEDVPEVLKIVKAVKDLLNA